MAGGGVRRGMSYGQSDDLAFNAAENPVHVHDFKATGSSLAWYRSRKRLTYRFQGRDFRLTDVGCGRVVNEIIIA